MTEKIKDIDELAIMGKNLERDKKLVLIGVIQGLQIHNILKQVQSQPTGS